MDLEYGELNKKYGGKMFCKHDWKIMSEVTTESRMEQLKRLEKNVAAFNAFDLKRKHIQVFVCTKCGGLKRFVEDI